MACFSGEQPEGENAMSSRLSPALAEFAEGRWPGEQSLDPRAYDRPTYDQHPYDRHTLERHTLGQHELERHTMEPPLHPSERESYESGFDQFETNERWSSGRRVAAALARFLIAFGIGIAATLVWQSYGGAARGVIAGLSPQLGWLAPQPAPAASPPLASSASASPDQLAAISRSLTVVRQSVDKLTADITRLQTARPDPPPVRTAGPAAAAPQPAPAAPARKPAPPVVPSPTTAR
jgi:hypothetical protein